MKLILLESIQNLEQLPLSINQAKNLMENGKVAFKQAYSEISSFIRNNILGKNILSDADELEARNILNDLDKTIPNIADNRINNTIFNSNDVITNQLDTLYNLADKVVKATTTPKEDQDIENELDKAEKEVSNYDLPFEQAKTDAERRAIINKFLDDKDFWGKNITYMDLRDLGSPLVTQLIYKGFNETDNPFLVYLKQVLPNRDITEDKYRILHNLYVSGNITDDDLRKPNHSVVSRYIRHPALWKKSPEIIDRVIRQNSRTSREPWGEMRNNIGLTAKVFKTCMAVINELFAESDAIKASNIKKYDLPKFNNAEYNAWKRQLDKIIINSANYTNILEDIYNTYNKRQ